MATCEIEVWACVDDEGQYEVGCDDAAAREKYEDQYGALNERAGHRMVSMVITVPLPEVVSLTGSVPADGPAVMAVA